MAFTASSASIDLIDKTARVVFSDPPTNTTGATVTVFFNYEAAPGDGPDSKKSYLERCDF